MFEKPKSLSGDYPTVFQDRSVAEAYRHQPPYPKQIFEILCDLMPDGPRRLLDVGSGLGNIARPMTEYCNHVDAVDFSEALIEIDRELPGGDRPRVTSSWRCACSPRAWG